MESYLLLRTFSRFLLSSLTFLLVTLTATTNSLTGQTLIGPSELLANTEATYSISDPSVSGGWEVNGSATVSSNLVNQNAIKVKANNFCYGRFTVIVKIGDKYLFRRVDIIKNLPPIFTSGATTATLSCNSTLDDFDNYKPTAKDIDGNAVEVELIDMTPMQMGRCQSILTWQATDKCGNKAFFKQTIEIVGNDTQAPVFDQSTLKKTFYDCDKIPRTFPTPKATDNCVNPVMVKLVRREVSERIRSSIACMSYFEILTWEATDVCGNKTQADQTICVVDNIPPVFGAIPTITVPQCGFDYNQYAPKATDNCSSPVMVMAVNFQSTTTGVGRRTVVITWEATDMCGNATRAMQTFFVVDETPPRINRGLPLPNITIECSNLLNNIQVPTGFDDCGDPVDVIFASRRIIVAGNCNGIIEITWKATDASGNMSFAKQIVNINDKTPPVITCPAALMVSCASEVPAPNVAAVVATDNCDDDVAKAFVNDVISNRTCANRYTITRTYRGTDDCGNATNCTQIITVNDLTPPMITCPIVNGTATCPGGTPTFGDATAMDNCGQRVAIAFTDATTGMGCNVTITRTWTATDVCGNTSTCSRSIATQDVSPPTITCVAQTTPINCPNAPVFTPPTATDLCDANVAITFIDAPDVPGACAGTFTRTRTWTATDDCMNTSTCSRSIVVRDVTAPTITCVAQTTPIDCPNAPVFTAPTATDLCDANVVITFIDVPDVPGACAGTFTRTRTWTATDDCMNTSTCSRSIVVRDVSRPVITCPTVNDAATCPGATPTFGNATATDNCDQMVTITFADVTRGMGCNVTTTRTWTATDDCGLTATCSRSITTQDNTPPRLVNCPADRSVTCVNPPAVPAFGPAPTATDNCDQSVNITFADVAPVLIQCTRIFRRIWTATDVCGNTATCSQTITETPMVQFFQNGVPIGDGLSTVVLFVPALNTQTDPCCVGDFFTSINITVVVCGGAPISLGANNAQVCLSRNGNSVNYKLDGLTISFTACGTKYMLMGDKTNGVIQGKRCIGVVCPAGQGFYDANGVPICDAVGGNNCTFCSTPPPPPIAPRSNLDIVSPQGKDKTHQHVSKELTLAAFPNPTTGDINFSITTPTKGDLRLKLFDASGKQIGLIVRQGLEGGFENQINYNIPANVSSGLIFYTVTVGEEVKSGKLMYMKN